MSRCARPRGDGGAAAVEFALVSVLLLTLLFGIIQYAYYFFQSQGASATARETARLAAVGVDSCTAFESAALGRADSNGTDLADDTTPTADIALEFRDPTTNSAVASVDVGDLAHVEVTWKAQDFAFPFVPFFSGSTVEKAETRVERVGDKTVTSC